MLYAAILGTFFLEVLRTSFRICASQISLDGWMGEWVGGWMDGWMDRWIDGWIAHTTAAAEGLLGVFNRLAADLSAGLLCVIKDEV